MNYRPGDERLWLLAEDDENSVSSLAPPRAVVPIRCDEFEAIFPFEFGGAPPPALASVLIADPAAKIASAAAAVISVLIMRSSMFEV